ncbi:hypothetical protein OHB26_34185 [Nocardia sp. NBC_01503]|uniref:hypothetical protein n=1 Tax=Nocardia sp. NBC_01503 TaxID=2975997 RepID=UPI002E7C06DC|nr:hypothetical protein [Nocardia sp. NBC_01503]WTL31893.1 hypothetical protein OHB26_34185 [Nocardia sp. NBC_01503]
MAAEPENSAERPRNDIGLPLAAVGLVSVALTMAIAGYGFSGWAILSGLASALLLWFGISIELAEQRRAAHSDDTSERPQRLR